MKAKKNSFNSAQLSLFDDGRYEYSITEASIDADGWEPEIPPVPDKTVERVEFSEGFSIGQEVLFIDDSISSQKWHNQRCVIESLSSPVKADRLVVRFADGSTLHPKPNELAKIPPVAREIKERVEFHWVEEHLSHGRYLYHRYCYLSEPGNIKQVEKIHIPGNSSSVREGRAQLVREAIADGKTPDEIRAIIRCW